VRSTGAGSGIRLGQLRWLDRVLVIDRLDESYRKKEKNK